MSECVKVPVEPGEWNNALQSVFRGLLEKGVVQGVFAPMRQPDKRMVMPTLIKDPDRVTGLDPLAPVTSMSAARALSALTVKESGFRIAAFLRPCDLRAFVELVKLRQARTEEVLLITTDCFGRMEPRDFLALAHEEGEAGSLAFIRKQGQMDGLPRVRACEVCEFPVHGGADIAIRLFGVDPDQEIVLAGQTNAGKEALGALDLEICEEPGTREGALNEIMTARTAERDGMFKEYGEKTASFSQLRDLLSTCINCYNCRVACPVCYCRECVFVTDTFRHDPEQYFRWADKRGQVKLPTDTIFFHLTRMLHMSTLCVGCGQCSTACPMDLPVMEIFRTVASKTQKRFSYEPGRNPEEPLPLSVFEEQEFTEICAD